MKIVFAILTWGSKEERKENFKFSLFQLKKLTNFLKANNIECSIYPYCFGKEKLTEDSFHSNLEFLNYHKSFKLNYVIKNIIEKKENPDIFCLIDCDILILEKNFQKILFYLQNTNFNNTHLTARWYDSANRNDFNFQNFSIKDNLSIETVRGSDAGGVFLVNFEILKNIGGFDERFTVWGGEDNDISLRLERIGVKQEYMNFYFLHIKHQRIDENLILGTKDKDIYLNQVKIAQNDKSVVRPTLINDYYVQDKIQL